MIGNDVVDLQLAKVESNWQRKGFLDKLFTKKEQNFIALSKNNEVTVWNLWSRKEAAYKIWNRESGIRKFNPIQFECQDMDSFYGKVTFENHVYLTKTKILSQFIHTIAVLNVEDFDKIKVLKKSNSIKKVDNLHYFIKNEFVIIPISRSHHGRFEMNVYLSNS